MLSRAHVAVVALVLFNPWILSAESLSAVVKDSSGGLLADASVTLEGRPLQSARHASTDSLGHVRFDSLPSGSYHIAVVKDGFDRVERTVSLSDKPVELSVVLNLKVVTTTVQVSGRRSPLANSDPNYVALREGRLTKVYRVSNLVLRRDAGTFTFRSGSFSFLPPVLGQVATGVFVGDGNFQLKPHSAVAVQHLRRLAGMDSVDEDFTALVVYFTDATFDEIKLHSELADEAPHPHETAFQRVKDILERRREPSIIAGGHPLSPLERLLNYEDIPNYQAEILAELYNPAQRGSFRAFLHGTKHSDLRFLLNPRGALPMLPAPEEIAVIYFDPGSNRDGVWYLSHLASELDSGRASSNEDKRLIEPEHYKIDAFIGRANVLNSLPDLAATCELRFRSLEDGTRMIKFDLMPDLQVSRASWDGKEIPFIQERRQQDGSFYLQTPEALAKGRTYQVSFEYAGGEILQSRFGWVPFRRVWYPTPPGAASRATYDLTFRIPHGSTIVTVGNPVRQSRDGSFDLTQWICETPVAQAVFRYLYDPFQKTNIEAATNMRTSVYVDTSRPTYFLPPASTSILANAGNALRVYNAWFGKPAYDSLSVVVAAGPVDSLPGLVYAPPVFVSDWASLNTQAVTRQTGPGGIGNRGVLPMYETFLDEAFPAQVAGQWWGNTVSPISFHDTWLASGFANFSASLYDAEHERPDEYGNHWVNAHDSLLRANWNGATVAGPLWMGTLNETCHSQGIGSFLAASKGGYIVHMLRSMMWDPKTQDSDFRAMMRDYLMQFANRAVSTEDFQGVVERHMKPVMDLQHNHRMDWFFREWVYETDLPSYRMEYSLTPENGGKKLLTVKLTQSGVSPDFAMPVPFFAEYAGKKMRLGVAAMYGNCTGEFKVLLPEEPKRVLLNINHDVLSDREEVKRVK